jgi:phosphoribosylanthranilate isomerase
MNFSLLPVPGIFCLRWNGDRIPEYKRFQADMILVDYFDPKLFGGSGQTLAWEHIPKEIPRERLILAGGITSANISRALEMVNPAVVDVASGAESSPGLKDLSKVKSLVAQVRKYNQDKKI